MLTTVAATTADEPFLYEVYAGTRREEVAAWGWGHVEQEAFLRMQYEAQKRSYQLRYPGAVPQIVLRDQTRVGRLIVDGQEHAICLVDLSLLPPFRNAGIGTALLQRLMQTATARNQPLCLQVYRSNPAVRLYQRLGLRIVNDDGVYLAMEWQPAARDDK